MSKKKEAGCLNCPGDGVRDSLGGVVDGFLGKVADGFLGEVALGGVFPVLGGVFLPLGGVFPLLPLDGSKPLPYLSPEEGDWFWGLNLVSFDGGLGDNLLNPGGVL